MNKKIRCLLVALLLAPVAVLAAKGDGPKAKAMAKYDLNHDGKLDEAESAAIQQDFAADPKGGLARFDTDKDGKLSAAEIAKIIPGSGKKSEKSEKSADKKTGAKIKTDETAKDTKAADGK